MNAVANDQVWHWRLGHFSTTESIYFTQAKQRWYHTQGGDLGLRCLRRGEMQHLAHLKTANHTVSRPFQLCYGDLMGPFTPVAIGGYKYVSKIIDEYTKWTVVDQQEQSSSVTLTIRRLDGHTLRRPDRTFSRRQGRQVHRGGVSIVLLRDRYYSRVRRHQHAEGNWCVRMRGENSAHHGSVDARRQRILVVHVGGAVHGDGIPHEHDSIHGAQEGDAIPNTSRRGSRPFAPSRYWSQNLLRACKGLQKGQHRGLGREGVRLH